ncbi:DUF547 domain-containing protein [Aquimarina muelleri]|uniref:DUF547 domain-containing protein n=1 Tax=Aquimarina muelleri TaxID=279356 RepID=A0A918JX32_9FLAO|nr:DUF547 domain-containing protein [Aquimarina muelleri]MCX2764129.1 DUF547 domain-containing protein [Aquimarina muelleri]GGX22497.1 hypothetical protein GCM10007384_24630 [Aquimarina muelleri]
MKKTLIVLFVLSIQFGFSQTTADFFNKTDRFLKTHVSNGRVDYKSIKKKPSGLDELLRIASKIKVDKSKTTTYQAFYINAYNLAVIKGIIDNYPTKSPLDIKGFFDKNTYALAGNKITLNNLENNILRKNFPNEARFHFVLVCAGLGCPPIIATAYRPTVLEKQLQQQTVKALNNPDFIKVKGEKVQISQLFEWYKVDFTHHGSEIDYINTFRKEKITEGAKVSYYPYDWRLNDIQ